MVCFTKVGARRWVMCEIEMLFLKGFAFIIKPVVHGTRAKRRFVGLMTSIVGIGIKGCFHEDQGTHLIFA